MDQEAPSQDGFYKPVSTIPAVVLKMLVEAPYRIDWLMPQNWFAGEVPVMELEGGLGRVIKIPNWWRETHVNERDPVNSALSSPPRRVHQIPQQRSLVCAYQRSLGHSETPPICLLWVRNKLLCGN